MYIGVALRVCMRDLVSILRRWEDRRTLVVAIRLTSHTADDLKHIPCTVTSGFIVIYVANFVVVAATTFAIVNCRNVSTGQLSMFIMVFNRFAIGELAAVAILITRSSGLLRFFKKDVCILMIKDFASEQPISAQIKKLVVWLRTPKSCLSANRWILFAATKSVVNQLSRS